MATKRMSAIRKLLQYKDILDDDRKLSVVVVNWVGDIKVYYEFATYQDMTSDENVNKVTPEYWEREFDCGTGKTVEQAARNYMKFLQGKTICFSNYLDVNPEEYLVTFDFNNEDNIGTEESTEEEYSATQYDYDLY